MMTPSSHIRNLTETLPLWQLKTNRQPYENHGKFLSVNYRIWKFWISWTQRQLHLSPVNSQSKSHQASTVTTWKWSVTKLTFFTSAFLSSCPGVNAFQNTLNNTNIWNPKFSERNVRHLTSKIKNCGYSLLAHNFTENTYQTNIKQHIEWYYI